MDWTQIIGNVGVPAAIVIYMIIRGERIALRLINALARVEHALDSRWGDERRPTPKT